jgi:chromosome segregation ATPase
MKLTDFLFNRRESTACVQGLTELIGELQRDGRAREAALESTCARLRCQRNAARTALAEAEQTIRLLGSRNVRLSAGAEFSAAARTAAVRDRNRMAAELQTARARLAELEEIAAVLREQVRQLVSGAGLTV